MEYLYIAKSKKKSKENVFKIGISINPSVRLTEVCTDIDYDNTLLFVCNDKESIKIEKTLHFLFREKNIIQDTNTGYTEWFDISCYNEVLNFIETHNDKLGIVRKDTYYNIFPLKEKSGYISKVKKEKKVLDYLKYQSSKHQIVKIKGVYEENCRKIKDLICFLKNTSYTVKEEDQLNRITLHMNEFVTENELDIITNSVSINIFSEVRVGYYTYSGELKYKYYKDRDKSKGVIITKINYYFDNHIISMYNEYYNNIKNIINVNNEREIPFNPNILKETIISMAVNNKLGVTGKVS